MKRHILYFMLSLITSIAFSQKMAITALDNTTVDVIIISESEKQKILQDFNGKQENTIRKQWTARTYILKDDRVLTEFYDRQAVIFNNMADFEKLKEVRFIKTYIDFLKKSISYKIELTYNQGKEIVNRLHLKKQDQFKSESLDFTSIEVYELPTGQLLFINGTNISRSAAIYENIKALASECSDVQNQFYGDMEKACKKFINGDPLFDYETDGQWIYPEDLKIVLQNHKLNFIEKEVYVADFYGNLYKSEGGYYVLLDEINQKNGGGDKMRILTARVYRTIEDVRSAQDQYQKSKNKSFKSEHFYQKISDKYGRHFPLFTRELTDSLPFILNFDKEQLTFDSVGMTIVDEAIHWNHSDYTLFKSWFPCLLAYYGQCYMNQKRDGKWVAKKDNENNVWIPHLLLANGEDAFDVIDFYKDLSEWPIPIKWAGDWEGKRRQYRKHVKPKTVVNKKL